MSDVTFIIKQRNAPGYSYGNYGLLNSSLFIARRLNKKGLSAVVEEAIDNNDIDRIIVKHRPKIVIIEALWVVPEKFLVLLDLHPNVEWYVRIHSKAPFLANEGMSMNWINKYIVLSELYPNFHLSCNNAQFNMELNWTKCADSIYLPNIYDAAPIQYRYIPEPWDKERSDIHIGCFGAIRPFKNQLLQAMAAIVFADTEGKHLHFHINAIRMEQQGENVLKNIRALFKNTGHHLIEHDWYPHDEFLELVAQMDLGMQASFSESFNIVTADFVYAGVPIVVSEDVSWMPFWTRANPNSLKDMLHKLQMAWGWRRWRLQKLNEYALRWHNFKADRIWLSEILGRLSC